MLLVLSRPAEDEGLSNNVFLSFRNSSGSAFGSFFICIYLAFNFSRLLAASAESDASVASGPVTDEVDAPTVGPLPGARGTGPGSSIDLPDRLNPVFPTEFEVLSAPAAESEAEGVGMVSTPDLLAPPSIVPTTWGMPLSHQSLCCPEGRGLSNPIGNGHGLGRSVSLEVRCAEGWDFSHGSRSSSLDSLLVSFDLLDLLELELDDFETSALEALEVLRGLAELEDGLLEELLEDVSGRDDDLDDSFAALELDLDDDDDGRLEDDLELEALLAVSSSPSVALLLPLATEAT